MKEKIIRLAPGETHTTADPRESIVATLGPCIAACVRDPLMGMGGMNHFMLPESESGISSGNPYGAATLFGNFAMEMLINSVLGMGCPRSRLEIRLFGGADFTHDKTGGQNIDFILRYLRNDGLEIASSDLGGSQVRRIHFHPVSGKIRRVFLAGARGAEAIREEGRYRASHHVAAPQQGAISFFE
jgi:chemotaxis protein CheD